MHAHRHDPTYISSEMFGSSHLGDQASCRTWQPLVRKGENAPSETFPALVMRVCLLAALAASGHALSMTRASAAVRLPRRCGAPVLVASQLEEAIQQTTASNEVVIYRCVNRI